MVIYKKEYLWYILDTFDGWKFTSDYTNDVSKLKLGRIIDNNIVINYCGRELMNKILNKTHRKICS